MRWKAVETKDLGLRLKGTPTDHDPGQDVGLRLARSPELGGQRSKDLPGTALNYFIGRAEMLATRRSCGFRHMAGAVFCLWRYTVVNAVVQLFLAMKSHC